ncbi:Dyp-type peroxidase [Bradyrhizobium xenonodulans]|uniref:Dyp-type peroxidase n=1 Tax=Bradyrhizobium xenonodulans TaxID=2736875 RepID=A0ABY7MVN9_9BRAD|nr:Dyp-type peroxidase [Bradyrhizobium xenonodulans]WBL82414.1 Dyp-type peroxidase [Bradyrhizobium xenonodulans]
MRRDLTIKTGSMAGTSDFRVMAPIKKGFVPCLDATTYKTRVKYVLRALNGGRVSAYEYELARVLSDSVERVGRIHSVGIAVLEPEDETEDAVDYVLLTATFDGSWEAYVRVIWQKAARLLDLIFCNTDGYVFGHENTYENWGIWLKSKQTEAYFLYATPDLTVDDTRFLRMEERVYRRASGAGADRIVTQIRIPSPEDIARRSIFQVDDQIGVDPTNAGFSEPLTIEAAGRPAFYHGIRALAGLYRLADFYPPGTHDGVVLHRAAHELLPEFVIMINAPPYAEGVKRARRRYEEALNWLLTPPDVAPVRQNLPLALPPEPPLQNPGNVQGGILSPYPDSEHGCLLLLQFANPAALAAFLNVLVPKVTSEADVLTPGQIVTNIAFTVEGLRHAGLTDAEVRTLPEEFLQGMERRAGLLGDVRWNHPQRWRLPASNWARGIDAPDLCEADPAPRISMSSVHAVLQLRLLRSKDARTTADARNALMAEMNRLVEVDAGVRPLSIQWMQRQRDKFDNMQDHFGFADGSSNPVLNAHQAGKSYSNQVHLGEILCGYPNLADETAPLGDETNRAHAMLRDGSFMALRKLRQDVEQLADVLSRATEQATKAAGPDAPALTREMLMAKMMGRWPTGHPQAGQPLTPAPPPGPQYNDFNYDADAQAQLCPFHAHIRRANPRVLITEADAGVRPPRIVRRGMSYGPPFDPQAATSAPPPERGLVFMAYNASLGEQFEVVQSWLAGGNSSGSSSGESDPFLGLAEPGRLRHFRFEHGGQTVRVALDGSDRLHDEPRPFVRLEWGAYFFAPSKKALADLQQWAASQGRKPAVTWCANEGEKEIARLRLIERRQGEAAAMDAWKTALEDPDSASHFVNASIWAAIRERHGGALRTPFGVLVADRDLVSQVFADSDTKLTITGYLPRMTRSFGILYLGRDARQPDQVYEQESAVCNAAIMALDQFATFELARAVVHKVLGIMVKETIGYAAADGEASWELTVDVHELVDPLLGAFCEAWFGLSEAGGFFRRAGYRWDWKQGEPPGYPGHFLSPSRYIFQPHPNKKVEEVGAAHGDAARRAMEGFLTQFGPTNGPVTKAVYNSSRGTGDIPFVARTIAGAMMGFIPTVDGNLRRILNEWLREGTLWALRARYAGTVAKDYTDARNRLRDDFIPAMQLRAVPELIWRTAIVSHTIGDVEIRPGDVIVAGAVSATQQNLVEGRQDIYHAFGGNRRVEGHPTHSCPGADPALAVMLGFFSALVETPLPLRAGPIPLSLTTDGRVPAPLGSS